MLTKLTHVLCRSSVFLYSSQTLFCAFPALYFVFFFACDWHAFAHDLPSLWPANGGEWCGWWVRVNCNLRATWRPSNGLICHLPGNRWWAGTSWIDCSVNLNFASELCFPFAASYCAVFTPPRIHLQAAHTNWVNLPPPPLCALLLIYSICIIRVKLANSTALSTHQPWDELSLCQLLVTSLSSNESSYINARFGCVCVCPYNMSYAQHFQLKPQRLSTISSPS